MLSKVLHSHLDEQDTLDEKSKKAIDKIISTISIKSILKDPHEELGAAIQEISNLIINELQPIAHKQGISLANEIKKRDVIIDPSNDPTKNQGIIK